MCVESEHVRVGSEGGGARVGVTKAAATTTAAAVPVLPRADIGNSSRRSMNGRAGCHCAGRPTTATEI
jgi:hypothetical protein